MPDHFQLNAYVKLMTSEENQFDSCEVGAVSETKFVINLKELFDKILVSCQEKLGADDLSLVSFELMPSQDKIKITANTLWAEDEEKHQEVELQEEDRLGVYRLFKYMEVMAKKLKGDAFVSLVHVCVTPLESNDLPADKF